MADDAENNISERIKRLSIESEHLAGRLDKAMSRRRIPGDGDGDGIAYESRNRKKPGSAGKPKGVGLAEAANAAQRANLSPAETRALDRETARAARVVDGTMQNISTQLAAGKMNNLKPSDFDDMIPVSSGVRGDAGKAIQARIDNARQFARTLRESGDKPISESSARILSDMLVGRARYDRDGNVVRVAS